LRFMISTCVVGYRPPLDTGLVPVAILVVHY
jgi:hypothetical protein